jgi:DNA gyrase subunit B
VLSDCACSNASESELFIVRPNRSGVLAKSVRDRSTQAVLPIGENIAKVSGVRLPKLLENEEVLEIIAALGVGLCFGPKDLLGPEHFLARLRYGKIVIAMDESVDGRYTRTQVLCFLYRFMVPVVNAGRVYISPLNSVARITEAEFEATVMAPATRRLNRVKLGTSMASTLVLNDVHE